MDILNYVKNLFKTFFRKLKVFIIKHKKYIEFIQEKQLLALLMAGMLAVDVFFYPLVAVKLFLCTVCTMQQGRAQ